MTRLLLPLLLLCAPPAAARTLTVEDAVKLALEHDAQVRAAEHGLDKAEADAAGALLGLGPGLTVAGSYMRLGTIPYVEFDMSGYSSGSSACDDLTEDDVPPGWTLDMVVQLCEMITGWMAGSGEPTRIEMGLADNYSVTATVQQVLFAGGAMWAARRAAVDLRAASEAQLRLARQQAAYNAEQGFHGLLLVRDATGVAAEAQATVDAYVQDLANLASVGMASQADLLAAQARQSQTRLDAMRAAHGRDLAEMVFKVTLGIPADEPIELVVGDLPAASDLPRDRGALLDLALSRRPDLAALDRNLDALEHYARAARASWMPSLVLQGDLGWKNPDYSLEPNWYRTSDLVLAASWSLWDRGQALTKTRATRAARAQLAAQRGLLADMLGVEIRSALSTVDEAAAEIEVARGGLAQATESLRMEQERFRQGMANNTQLLAAQAALSGARLAVLQAETRLRTSHAALRKAAGVDPGVTP